MNTFTPTWNHLRDPVYDTRHLPQYPPETIAKHQGYQIPEPSTRISRIYALLEELGDDQ